MFIVTYTAKIVDTNTSLRNYRSSFLRVIFRRFLWFHLMSAQCPLLKIGFYVSHSDNNRRKHFKTFHQNKLDLKTHDQGDQFNTERIQKWTEHTFNTNFYFWGQSGHLKKFV